MSRTLMQKFVSAIVNGNDDDDVKLSVNGFLVRLVADIVKRHKNEPTEHVLRTLRTGSINWDFLQHNSDSNYFDMAVSLKITVAGGICKNLALLEVFKCVGERRLVSVLQYLGSGDDTDPDLDITVPTTTCTWAELVGYVDHAVTSCLVANALTWSKSLREHGSAMLKGADDLVDIVNTLGIGRQRKEVPENIAKLLSK